MSRIGKMPIKLSAGVEAKMQGNLLSIKGPKGENTCEIHPHVIVEIDAAANEIKLTSGSGKSQGQSLVGLFEV